MQQSAYPMVQDQVGQAQQPAAPQTVYYAQPIYMPVPCIGGYDRKSVGLAFLLTFFFGPFGMLYSTVSGALIMLFLFAPLTVAVAVGVGFLNPALSVLALIVAAIAYWPACIIGGCVAASSHNN